MIHNDHRRGHAPDAPRGVDVAALDAFSECAGVVLLEGRRLPAVRPKGEDWRRPGYDQMGFDRRVCAAGLPEFVRPAMPSDQPNGLPLRFTSGWILVSEITPGVRTRREVDVRWT